jgi:hypothetical protein
MWAHDSLLAPSVEFAGSIHARRPSKTQINSNSKPYQPTTLGAYCTRDRPGASVPVCKQRYANMHTAVWFPPPPPPPPAINTHLEADADDVSLFVGETVADKLLDVDALGVVDLEEDTDALEDVVGVADSVLDPVREVVLEGEGVAVGVCATAAPNRQVQMTSATAARAKGAAPVRAGGGNCRTWVHMLERNQRARTNARGYR